MTVSGSTMTSAVRQADQNRASQVQSHRFWFGEAHAAPPSAFKHLPLMAEGQHVEV
jgi:hypothetical protein